MLLRHYRVHRQSDTGVHRVGHRADAVPIDPLANDLGADIGFVEVIGGQDFDLEAGPFFRKILGRHVRGDDGSLAGLIRERAVHVVEDADFDGIGQFGLRESGWQHERDGYGQMTKSHFHPSRRITF